MPNAYMYIHNYSCSDICLLKIILIHAIISYFSITSIYYNIPEFGISNLCAKPAFVNDVDIH